MGGRARIETRRYPGGTESHRHDAHHQIVLPLGGRMAMEAAGRAGRIDPTGFAVLPAGTIHDFEAAPGHRFLIVDLPPAPGEVWERAADAPFGVLDAALAGYAELLAEAAEAGHPAAGDGAGLLLGAIARRLGVRPLPRGLAAAMAAMRADLAQPHRVGRLAREAGMSERRLHAAFQDCLGTSPMAWLAAERMAAARRLLTTTTLGVTEIAARTGYDDPAAFARAFRRATGEAPGAFRTRFATAVRQDRHG